MRKAKDISRKSVSITSIPRGRASRGLKRAVGRPDRATCVCWCNELAKYKVFLFRIPSSAYSCFDDMSIDESAEGDTCCQDN